MMMQTRQLVMNFNDCFVDISAICNIVPSSVERLREILETLWKREAYLA